MQMTLVWFPINRMGSLEICYDYGRWKPVVHFTYFTLDFAVILLQNF